MYHVTSRYNRRQVIYQNDACDYPHVNPARARLT